MAQVIQPVALDNGYGMVQSTTAEEENPNCLPPVIKDKILSMNWSTDFPLLDPFTLLILIQEAHYLDLKYQMDLSCRTLANKVRARNSGVETKTSVEPNVDQEYGHFSVAKFSNGRLRNHGRETFIHISKVVGFGHSALADTNDIPPMFDDMEENLECDDAVNKFLESSNFLVTDDVCKDIEKLEEATTLLRDLICQEGAPPYPLHSNVVERLVLILECKETQFSQYLAASILSTATYHDFSKLVNEKAVPVLVNLINHSLYQTARLVVITLTRIACESSDNIPLIVSHGALEAVHEFVSNSTQGMFYVVRSLAKLLAILCRGANLSPDKEELAITISQNLFQKNWHASYTTHIKRACYTLSYLSYGKPAAIPEEVCESVVKFLSHDDELVVYSALGVVGNIVRWGHGYQIQCLTEHCWPLQWLGERLLCSKVKTIRKEACKIISNLAVRSKTSVKNDADLIESLCKLLEKDESDVKMEAAWAIVNSIFT